MLSVSNLYKTYESYNQKYEAVKDVSFEIQKGEFVSLIGPSGSGKTTIFNCISGFLKSTSGEIKLEGKDIANKTESEISHFRSNKLGFVFQDFMLIDGLTVLENIFLPQIIAGKDICDIEKQTENLLSKLNILEIENKYPHEISGGQKQRVAVARALSNVPLIILADEPTGNLDSVSGSKVIDAFITAKRDLGTTIFMVTHDAKAASLSDRVIGIRDGQIFKTIKNNGDRKVFLDEIFDLMKA